MLLHWNRRRQFPLELYDDNDDDDYDDVGSRTTAARRGGDGSGKSARLGLLDGSGRVFPAFVVRADDDCDCDEEGSPPFLLCVPTPDRRGPRLRPHGRGPPRISTCMERYFESPLGPILPLLRQRRRPGRRGRSCRWLQRGPRGRRRGESYRPMRRTC